MDNDKTTIDKFLETFSGKGIDSFDAKEAINTIKAICSKIPANGEYDNAIVSFRIGEYIYGIQECGKLLAHLCLVEKYQEIEVAKAFSFAALEKAAQKGYKTDGKAKLYASMDEDYIVAKNKLIEIQAVIMYIETYRSSLDKCHLHCKKILDRNSVEERFAGDHEKHSIANGSMEWLDETVLINNSK